MAKEADEENLDIDAILLEGVLGGQISAHTKPDGETEYSLSDNGVEEAERLLGGKDIAVVASGLVCLLVEHGDAIGNIPNDDTPFLWLLMVQIARLWKEYHALSWEDWSAKMQLEADKRIERKRNFPI